MPSLGLYRQISNFFFCISSFDAKTSMYAKNHENLGHSMCHPLPGFSLDGLLKVQLIDLNVARYNIIMTAAAYLHLFSLYIISEPSEGRNFYLSS